MMDAATIKRRRRLFLSMMGGGSPTPQMFLAATRGQIPQTRYASGTSPATAANCVTETRKFFPGLSVAQPYIRLHYVGFFSALSSGERPGLETNVGNSRKVNAAIALGASIVDAAFGGLQQGVIPDGSTDYMSDKIFPPVPMVEWPANTPFYTLDRQEVADGEYICRYSSAPGMTGERSVTGAAGMATQLAVAGAWTGGTANQAYYGPASVVGPVACASLANIGDSIQNGANDTKSAAHDDGSTSGGFVMRAAYSVNSSILPVLNMAANGTTAAQFATENAKRMAVIRALGISHMIDNYGTNDSLTPAQIWSHRQTIQAAARAAGIQHITECTMLPRGTSSDSFVTAVNQTPTSGYETGGSKRDPVNALIRAPGAADAVHDGDKIVRDPTAPDRWRINGVANGYTDDGTHETPYSHIIRGQALRADMTLWARAGQAVPTPTFDGSALAFIARMGTAPPHRLKAYLSDLYAGADAASIPLTPAGPFDRVGAWLHNEPDSRLNFIGTDYPLVPFGAGTFRAYRSWQGDGSTGYYSTGFNPTTAPSPKMVQDSASIFRISYTDVQSTGEEYGNTSARIGGRNLSGQLLVRLMASASYTPAIADSLGYILLSRANAAGYDIYKDRPLFANRVAASIAPVNATIELGRVGSAYSAREIGMTGHGRLLTLAEHQAWYDLVAAFTGKMAQEA